MRLLKLIVAGAAVAVIVAAFRDLENQRWLSPAGLGDRFGRGEGEEDDDETEPVLGYDGMDQDTIIEWLDAAELDRATLVRMHRYEERHLARGPVLAAIGDLL